MKTKIDFLFGLLVLLLSATGCDKEDTPTIPYYAEMEEEVITKEVENISGYVVCKELDCVFICYSEYADEYALEYFKNGLQVNHNMDEAIQKDLKAHTIGVAKTDFDYVNIGYYYDWIKSYVGLISGPISVYNWTVSIQDKDKVLDRQTVIVKH